MARSRNIKPGFFLNDELCEIEPLGRLLFAGLWTIADRDGRLRDRPKKIKAQILPYDECDVPSLLIDLENSGFIQRYEIDDCQYIQILAWSKHQNPHKNETDSVIPSPEEYSTSTVQEQESHSSNRADSLNLIPDSLNPSKERSSATQNDRVPVQKIIDLYHSLLPTLPSVAKVTPTRRGYIQQRWREDMPTIEQWENFFDYVGQSDFLMGRANASNGRKPFRADIGWITKPENFTKIAEGKYHV